MGSDGGGGQRRGVGEVFTDDDVWGGNAEVIREIVHRETSELMDSRTRQTDFCSAESSAGCEMTKLAAKKLNKMKCSIIAPLPLLRMYSSLVSCWKMVV